MLCSSPIYRKIISNLTDDFTKYWLKLKQKQYSNQLIMPPHVQRETKLNINEMIFFFINSYWIRNSNFMTDKISMRHKQNVCSISSWEIVFEHTFCIESHDPGNQFVFWFYGLEMLHVEALWIGSSAWFKVLWTIFGIQVHQNVLKLLQPLGG